MPCREYVADETAAPQRCAPSGEIAASCGKKAKTPSRDWGICGGSLTTYERVAHIGGCGPVFNLATARAEGRLKRGDAVALYAQGAGFTRAAAILEVA